MRRLLRRLRQEREQQGLTQRQLGQRCGINPQTIARVENSQIGHPAFLTLYRLAKALGLDLQLRLCRPRPRRQ